MSQPTKYADLVNLIHKILPNATFDEDNYGQLVIYTDLMESRNSTTGEYVLVPFVSEE